MSRLWSLVLLVPTLALGQISGSSAYRPSVNGPISNLSHSLGLLSSDTSSTMNNLANRRNANLTAPPAPDMSRVPGMPRRSNYRSPSAGLSSGLSPSSSTRTLLTRRSTGYQPLFSYPFAGSPAGMYQEASISNPGLLLQPPDLIGDLAAVRSDAASQPSSLIDDINRRPAALTGIAQNYVNSRRQTYVAQAWEKFAQRQYRQAGELFALAESVSLDDTRARVELEVGMMMSAIASGQYSAASNCLRWLLTPDRRTGDFPDINFMDRVSEIKSRYGTGEAANDFRDHITRLDNVAVKSPDATFLQALHAVMLWARGGQAEALYVARNLPAPKAREAQVGNWVLLQKAMEQSMRHASAVAQSRPAPAMEPILTPDALTTK